MAAKKLTIAITIDNRKSVAEMLFGNGLSQNIKFLYDILVLLGHKPILMGEVEVPNQRLKIHNKEYSLFTLSELKAQKIKIHLLLEAGISIGERDRSELSKLYGTRTVCVRYGHTMFMDMEQICHNETLPPGLYIRHPHRVWASPHFENSFSYLETVYQAPVETVPYIWEPDFVFAPYGEADYQAVPDIYVMEPNISLLKNALIPMAIIERLFKNQPDSFGRAVVLNGRRFNERPFFLENLVKNMDSLNSKSNKVFFAPRASFAAVFQKRDILLGHQWGCELNYLYLEAFYKNIPLVHNSPAFKEAGYYYPEFRVDTGLEKLKQAIADRDIKSYQERCKKVLWRYSIHNPDVQMAYRHLLNRTMA